MSQRELTALVGEVYGLAESKNSLLQEAVNGELNMFFFLEKYQVPG